MTSIVTYQGDLRCESTHLKSNNSFSTDAPLDNNGKGEAFSPTDTVATAVASCMLTVMAIKATDMQNDLTGSIATVTKHMTVDPRRISQIDVQLDMQGHCDQRTQLILERVANTCPVISSLHPTIVKNIKFNWE